MNKEIKQLKDILDMETYLKERCYLPGEIYGMDGFFYQIFKADEPCKVIGESASGLAVVTRPDDKSKKEPDAQILLIRKGGQDHSQVASAIRFDATENNIAIFKRYFENGEIGEGEKFDEYKPGSTERALKQVMEMADAIIID